VRLLWTIMYECRIYIVLIFACWLFAIATFCRIFLSGQSAVLDKKLEDFAKEFPGLTFAVGAIMSLTTTFLIPKFIVSLIAHTFFR
jgi:hypothetical protein